MATKSLGVRLLLALPRLLVGTSAGRTIALALVVLGAVWFLVRREVEGGPAPNVGGDAIRSGTFSELSRLIAPSSGAFEIHGKLGTDATCKVRGETGSVTGDRWVFRGTAVVAESACEGRIETSGRVTATLRLVATWNGRSKGMGGDWEDTNGKATCEGELTGTLGGGGTWTATCKDGEREWESSMRWKLHD